MGTVPISPRHRKGTGDGATRTERMAQAAGIALPDWPGWTSEHGQCPDTRLTLLGSGPGGISCPFSVAAVVSGHFQAAMRRLSKPVFAETQ